MSDLCPAHDLLKQNLDQLAADIRSLREAVQGIDRNVATIKGYLGINGSQPGAAGAHQHHRGEDADGHLHQRITDVIAAAEAATDAATKASVRPDGVSLSWRAVYIALMVGAVIVVLAMVAGERARGPLGPVVEKAPSILVK